MIRLLSFVLIIVLILGGLGYWRYTSLKSNPDQLQTAQQTPSDALIEVPKTLPQDSLESRVKVLEDLVSKLVTQVNSLKTPTTQSQSNTTTDSTVTSLNSAITDLTARVSVLEKAAPAAATTSDKASIYIPLGAGGSWSNTGWSSLPEYEISLNPDNYPGYTGMILEVNFRMVDPTGTGSIRLYNLTDGSAVSAEISTTSTSYSVYSTSSFKLPSGTKTYRLQVKSPQGKDLLIQTARIKVTF